MQIYKVISAPEEIWDKDDVSHKGEFTEGEVNTTLVKTIVRRYFAVQE